ncbi:MULTISPECIES: antitoxin [Corynebacterium]|uniref:AbrB/MazE/SpoVT family DNA-binding domain-containing protein n=1 Tax=Corynebacterium coyleae TaxID=53374 RepID=A0ABX8KSX3_9CORY|nr:MULTISPECIES: AbrB/MazE/SpoVT family DNA-binding domain-containing protein [Corynebacterium]MDK6493329.1 AbrB/MazE/SpoVT family DNA-binding domain-containing protein [Corynebacterium coyleae]MDK8240623.1 AbrB/MazE/SpoVT family DNA-binding domain-containing protein [Corynebacterium coyleae]MDK8663818.1 AbrB/MazE/SpoVT family DNA-binding domain-containing protein [Corynebacterium coyleae]MDK8706641.1 AbrB/MazE/SpoVT family DNA-binding domain-containing protein [Corynebacterium coyleae]MDK8733
MTEAAADSVETTVFMSGNSQAIRIPKDFRFDSETVWLKKIGGKLYVSPEPLSALDVLDVITADLPDGWADEFEEPSDLPLDPIPKWDE